MAQWVKVIAVKNNLKDPESGREWTHGMQWCTQECLYTCVHTHLRAQDLLRFEMLRISLLVLWLWLPKFSEHHISSPKISILEEIVCSPHSLEAKAFPSPPPPQQELSGLADQDTAKQPKEALELKN